MKQVRVLLQCDTFGLLFLFVGLFGCSDVWFQCLGLWAVIAQACLFIEESLAVCILFALLLIFLSSQSLWLASAALCSTHTLWCCWCLRVLVSSKVGCARGVRDSNWLDRWLLFWSRRSWTIVSHASLVGGWFWIIAQSLISFKLLGFLPVMDWERWGCYVCVARAVLTSGRHGSMGAGVSFSSWLFLLFLLLYLWVAESFKRFLYCYSCIHLAVLDWCFPLRQLSYYFGFTSSHFILLKHTLLRLLCILARVCWCQVT